MRPLYLLTILASLALAQGGDRWERMSQRDADGDGKISREEFPGSDRFFDRMDADGDGFVTKEEAAAMPARRGGGRGGRGGTGGRGGAERMLRHFDADKDGKVSDQEWQAFFEKADENGDEFLDSGELGAALMGRRYNDTAPKVGDAIPAVKARRANARGEEVDLAKVERLTVLVFGSWTWGPFNRQAGRLAALHAKYKSKADFYMVYLKEAHAEDGPRPARHVKIRQPETFDAREEIATKCCDALDLKMPLLVDDMKNTVATAFNAMPDRLFILEADGKIAYRGNRGPRGFDVDDMEKALQALVAPKTNDGSN